jgi:hypothetical protein
MLISTERIPLSVMQNRVAEAICINRRRIRRMVKEGEIKVWKKLHELHFMHSCMNFQLHVKLDQKCTKSVSDDFNEAGLRRILHNTYPKEKIRLTLKAMHVKMCESAFLKDICLP